ncbi:MAG: SH3 domain-containing protein [Devosia sp.]
MSPLSRLFAGLALAAGLVVLPGVADAAPGRAAGIVNVRSGPGLGYPVIASLSKDQYVIVVQCLANWCEIRRIGKSGWVSRKLLYNPYYSSGPGKGYEFAPKTPAPGRSSSR